LDPITSTQNSKIPPGGLPLGETVLLVSGQTEPVTVRPDSATNPTGLIIEGSGFTLRLVGLSVDVQLTDSSGRGVLLLEQSGTASVEGFGFSPGTPVYVWLFSQPRLLGTLTVDADGAFGGTVPIPGDVPVGGHTLQINGLTPEGQVRSLSLGVQVDKAPSERVARKAKATVYFPPVSATLDATAKKSLSALVKGRKKAVTRIAVNGFVQGANVSASYRALSLARAQAVAKYLKSQGVTGKVNVRAKGVAKKTGASGRKAVVTITYRK
jgi:flagellar motor protein MotB